MLALCVNCHFRFADFVRTCCRKNADDNIACEDVTDDYWINLLVMFIFATKVLVILYSPYFIPRSLYYPEYGSTEYVYCPDKANAQQKSEAAGFKIRVMFTQDAKSDENVQELLDKVISTTGRRYNRYISDYLRPVNHKSL